MPVNVFKNVYRNSYRLSHQRPVNDAIMKKGKQSMAKTFYMQCVHWALIIMWSRLHYICINTER